MNKYVADTMAIVLYLEDRKLPEKGKLTFKETVAGKNELYISVVSLMEIGYLFEKKRIDTSITAVIELTREIKVFPSSHWVQKLCYLHSRTKLYPNCTTD